MTQPAAKGLGNVAAGVLVFVTSAVVLVIEIVAARLLAPYVGVTLETFTTIIGAVLAAIAVGTWAGGWLADRFAPHRLLGPLIVAGGILISWIIPVVRLIGPGITPGSLLGLTAVTVFALFAPAAMLSAVSPVVVKLRLHDLASTGETVGRLSAIGTLGALAGSFLTGFVFVATMSSTTIITSSAVIVSAIGVVVWARFGQLARTGAVAVLPCVAVGVVLTVGPAAPCQIESAYFCARVVPDENRSGGRTLFLDNLRHSYVDLNDLTYLDFDPHRSFAAIVDTVFPAGAPVDALHIGGAGFTMPRWLEATHPGSRSLVLELDPTLVNLAESDMGLVLNDRLQVRVGDARLGVRAEPDDAYDLVVGDAFGRFAVPWHLTTAEFVTDVARVLRPAGVYLVNVIDHPPLDFVRAEAATLAARFEHIAVIATPEMFAGSAGGNFVLAASDVPIEVADVDRALSSSLASYRAYTDLSDWTADARVLTDDFAPVDQLLSSRN